MAKDNSDDPAREVGHVSIRPSKFSKEKPVIWFIQIEVQFANKITQDLTKFYHALQALNADILAEISELITNPPASNKQNIKNTHFEGVS